VGGRRGGRRSGGGSPAWKKSMHVRNTAAEEPHELESSPSEPAVISSPPAAPSATRHWGVKSSRGNTGGWTRLAPPKEGYRVESVWIRYVITPCALQAAASSG
jgi:hypothetical protein